MYQDDRGRENMISYLHTYTQTVNFYEKYSINVFDRRRREHYQYTQEGTKSKPREARKGFLEKVKFG